MNNQDDDSSIKKLSLTKRAGLIIPIKRIARRLKNSYHLDDLKLGVGAAIYFTAVLEYLVAELMHVAISTCQAKKLRPKHLIYAIKNDPEFREFFKQSNER